MGSGTSSVRVSKAALISDIQKLNSKNPGSITRNFYRANGKFSEGQWQKFFPKFTDFLSAAGIETTKAEPETSYITGDSWTISLPKTSIHTLDELLEHCKVNLAEWTVDKFIVNKWEANAGGDRGIQDVYQVKAWLKRRLEVVAVRNEIADLKKQAMLSAPYVPAVTFSNELSGNMLEINFPDVHFGKLAWPVETGHEPYDTKIANVMFMRALETVIERTSHFKIDYILFVVGNDLFNSDDVEGRTTKGTQVTTDGRYHRTFYKVRHTITDAILRLRQIAPVKVLMVSGNHDNLSVWHLGDSLECLFSNTPDVEIENVPTYRKYQQWGKVMLMFTHGDKGKRLDYPLLMAAEQPVMFGATKFRECHCGHTHETKMNEQHGVRVRVLPALCPPDDWHSENGYVGNLRTAEGYVWNKDSGLIGMGFHNDDAEPTIVTTRELTEVSC